ncbi:MAG: undecaprenyl/decaprenyl-phosphate alpha-N-acetylglucosaminyl 1-phosphate transferase [Phycisphaerae bacterium]|nr:undecaprenyl/decaprenyl-phosphate alpha-N-acetylglucosaminyl 1-phosphate transferase [Phycisphaerae bacterium]
MVVWAALGAMGLAFAISVLATPLMRKLAGWFNMVDVPSRHKTHAGAVPLLGGCAIFIAILAPALGALAVARVWAAGSVPSWVPAGLGEHVAGAAARAPLALGILAGAMALHVLGLIDDRRHLGAWIKLAGQTVVAAGMVAFCDVRILATLGGPISFILTILWLVVITNAFNLMGNVDGLSAGVAAICAASLLGVSAGTGQLFVSAGLCLVIGALAGFLPYNFPPAKIFMGNAGSLVIGFLLGVLSCLTTYVPAGRVYYLYGIFVPLVLMAVPLYDMFSVIMLRIRERRNPMVGDNRLSSGRLIKRGMSVRKTLLTIYLCAAGTGVAASLLGRATDNTGAVLVFAQTVTILLIVALLETSHGRS